MFSILIPTWNNLPYLKLCVESLRKNSSMDHQIILHINEGTDGTLDWARAEKLTYTFSPENAGICVAMNMAATKALHPYLFYLNDDMYCCPGWDKPMAAEIGRLGTDCFMLSATMIEPVTSRNNCVIVKDFGSDTGTFREQELLSWNSQLQHADWSGSTWPPTLIHQGYWEMIGGYSLEFSPGMSSDDDLSMKMWLAGCRIFKGIGESRVYHFQCKSTGRIKRNNGRKQFLMKWGLNQSAFRKLYLRMGMPYSGKLEEPAHSPRYRWELFRAWLKRRII